MNLPSSALADYTDTFLRDAPWLRRRVETIAFLDVDTVIRRTTLDVGQAEVGAASEGCPFFPDQPLVPLAMLKKDLLFDFSLRDRSDSALLVAPREVDAFFAWSTLCIAANKLLEPVGWILSTEISLHLRSITFDFPHPEDAPHDPNLQSWGIPTDWSSVDVRLWHFLLGNESFARLLREFTFNFILLKQLEVSSASQLVKFSYQQSLPYSEVLFLEKFGIRPVQLAVTAPAIGWARSNHLLFEAPEGLALTEVELFQIQRQVADTTAPTDSYEARLAISAAQVYTTSSITRGEHLVAVSMRVPIAGYLRAVWLTSVVLAVVLVLARWKLDELLRVMGTRSEAAVGMLLVAPSLLVAYLVRPGEHAIASRLLRPIRIGLCLAASGSYFGAALLILGWKSQGLKDAWNAIATLAGLFAGFLTVIIGLTQLDLNGASKARRESARRSVVILSVRE